MCLLTYLKRQKGKDTQAKSRIINIILSFMKCLSILFSIFSLIFSFTREPSLKMIIKSMVTIAFNSRIDAVFADSLPDLIKQNALEMN